MSAYALPGLFPPLPFYISDHHHHHVSVSLSIDDDPLSTQQRLDYSSLEKEEKVEYEPPVRRTRALTASSEPTTQPEAPSCCSCSCDQIDVSVKDARLDILQWIHSLTTSAAPLLSANAAAKRQQRCLPGKSRNAALLLNPDLKLVSGVTTEVSPPPALSSCNKERAMQLEMSISWNGRQYSVVRSLERLRYLRQELVAELEMLNLNMAAGAVPEMPHLPDNGSCANQSLAQLQGLLRSHIPAMQSWLNQVFRLVPQINDSATLTNFILEPVCLLQNTPVQNSESEYSLPSLLRRSSLASISEDDEEEE